MVLPGSGDLSRFNSTRNFQSWITIIRLSLILLLPLNVLLWNEQKDVLHNLRQVLLLESSSQSKKSSNETQSARTKQPHKHKPIAYVISLIKCGDHQSNIGGLVDAATVFAYSVHRHSVRHTFSHSKYDFKLYALVHEQAESCSGSLKDLGFEILVRDTPVKLHEISSDTLRKHAPRAWCCGDAEFIKLYAYTLLEHDIVVHVDIDFIFTKPMDDLYNAMLLDAHSPQAQAARNNIPLERPTDPWPDNIEAFVTRDWGQVIPGRKAGYQAGFVVLRPSMEIFEQVLETIRKTDYDEGYSHENGWGKKVCI